MCTLVKKERMNGECTVRLIETHPIHQLDDDKCYNDDERNMFHVKISLGPPR